MVERYFLGFLNELFFTLGAGDGNFAFSPGNPDHLAALGAIEIPMLPILDPIQQLQEFPVFLVALVGIPGQGPENGPEHHAVA